MYARFSSSLVAPVRVAAVAIAAAASCGHALAVSPFTFDPAAAGLAGTSFSADSIVITDYSTVTFSSPTSFTEIGYLPVASFLSGGSTVMPTGYGSTYGLYFSYTGSGTVTGSGSTSQVNFTDISYSLYGYNGSATFGIDGITHAPTETASGDVLLAQGSLISATGGTFPEAGKFGAYASANTTFAPVVGGFFAAPSPFYNMAFSSFINHSTEVTPFAGGFSIEKGGGSVNFASAVPEPQSYALMLAGLGALGFVARRRSGSSNG